MTALIDDITARLEAAFKPERIAVINESHLHAGHQPGMDGTGASHLRIRIISSQFSGMSRLARHRAVQDQLKEELEAGLHALAIEASAPGEPVRW